MTTQLAKSVRVELKTRDGVTLRGDFYKAEGTGRAVVVMAAGFSLLKELSADAAMAFQGVGISALAYDYRSFGSSDGMPRQEIDLYQQAYDFQDAISAAMRLPDVDPKKVIMWGVGHGATAAMIGAGHDPRIAGVVFHAPFSSGTVDAAHFPKGVLERVWKDREEKTLTGDTTASYQKVWRDWEKDGDGDPESVAIQAPMAFYLHKLNKELGDAAGTSWENVITLNSFINVASTEAQDHVFSIKQPTLYIVHDNDPFSVTPDFHRDVWLKMGSNAEFKVVSGAPDEAFGDIMGRAVAYQVEWVKNLTK